MIPVETPQTNFTYELPGRPGEGDLPCHLDPDKRVVTSYWAFEDADRAYLAERGLDKMQAVYVEVQDRTRLIWVGLAADDGEMLWQDKRARRAVARGTHSQLTDAPFTPAMAAHLAHGGLFVLKISGIPSPIVSVWPE